MKARACRRRYEELRALTVRHPALVHFPLLRGSLLHRENVVEPHSIFRIVDRSRSRVL
jgi:hypothetical protein